MIRRDADGPGCSPVGTAGTTRLHAAWAALTAAAVLAVSSAEAHAQDPPAEPSGVLEAGERVEVWSPLLVDRRERGILEALRSDTLVFRPGGRGPPERIPLSTVRRIRVAGAPEPSTLRGAFFGVVAGIAGAIAYDEATGERENGGGLVEPRWGLRAAIIAGGGLAGALVGRMIRISRWEEVPVPPAEP